MPESFRPERLILHSWCPGSCVACARKIASSRFECARSGRSGVDNRDVMSILMASAGLQQDRALSSYGVAAAGGGVSGGSSDRS